MRLLVAFAPHECAVGLNCGAQRRNACCFTPRMAQMSLFCANDSSITPLPPIPVQDPPQTLPDANPPNFEEPAVPDENPFPRVVPQPIATPEE